MNAPSFFEIIGLALLALLIFGPDKLPEMARKLGQTVSRVKSEANATIDELKRSADLEDLRGVRDDLRSTGRELKAVAALTGPMASSARPAAGDGPTVAARTDGPAPFDPDAT